MSAHELTASDDVREAPADTAWNARSSDSRRVFRNLSLEQLRGLILDGELGETDWVQRGSQTAWLELGVVPELADAIPAFTFRHDRGIRVVEAEEDMDMTPMIDIVFQLLLFFLLISTFQVQKAIGFPHPGDSKQARDIPVLGQLGRTSVVVSISQDDAFELLHYDEQGKLTRRESVEKEELETRFGEIAKTEMKTSVVVQADDKARHESVVAAIDAAYQANMEDIRIAQPVEADAAAGSSETAPPGAPAVRSIEDK